MVREEKRRYIFKAFSYKQSGLMGKKIKKEDYVLKYSMQGEKQHTQIQRQVGIGSQGNCF